LVRLKLSLIGDDTGHNFTFTSPPAIAIAEREKFKQELTTIIARNKSTLGMLHKPVVTVAQTTTPVIAQTPRPTLTTSHPADSRATSVVSERRATPVIAGNDPASEFRLRKKVLLSDPELGALHRELVMTGQITEAEFWDGREV